MMLYNMFSCKILVELLHSDTNSIYFAKSAQIDPDIWKLIFATNSQLARILYSYHLSHNERDIQHFNVILLSGNIQNGTNKVGVVLDHIYSGVFFDLLG